MAWLFLSRVFAVVKIVLTLLAVSLALFAYKRAVLPLYGGIPVNDHLQHVLMVATGLPMLLPRLPSTWSLGLLGLSLCLVPNSSYWVGTLTGQWKDPILGPVITHIAAFAPVVLSASAYILDINISPSEDTSPGLFEKIIVLQSFYWLSTVAADFLWPSIPYTNASDSYILVKLGATAFAVVIFSIAVVLPEPPQPPVAETPAIPAKRKGKGPKIPKKVELTAPVEVKGRAGPSDNVMTPRNIILTVLLSTMPAVLPLFRAPVPILEAPYASPTYPLRILSSTQSNTGRIVVGEILPSSSTVAVNSSGLNSIRYLRASHSIIGGVWIGDHVTTINNRPPLEDKEGTPLGDPIYSAFVLQEAARLVSSTKKGKEDQFEKALVVGLGAGSVVSAFHRHGMSTTILEIDSAVYDAARHYFGLPNLKNDQVFLEDARTWISNKQRTARRNPVGLFDIVVHDCFSGGGVPSHLYTVEFWDSLKSILHPDGVVAVTIAGVVGSEAVKAVVSTLQRSFSHCRAFHDSYGAVSAEKIRSQYLNIVLFCTTSSQPVTFRQPSQSDYLYSPLAKHILSSLSEREVDVTLLTGGFSNEASDQWVLTDENNSLGDWQKANTFEHWKVMREAFPDFVWETW